MPRSPKSQASALATAAGKRFEVQTAGELARMQAAGLVASIEHTQALFRCVGAAKFIPVKGGKADFHVLLRGPFFIAAECKSVAGHTLERSEFTAGEIADLDTTAAAGGLALVLVEFRFAIGGWQSFGVPWKCMPWKPAGRGLSAHVEALRGWELRRPDWLAPFLVHCASCRAYRLLVTPHCCGRH